jgi:hypothetical protein
MAQIRTNVATNWNEFDGAATQRSVGLYKYIDMEIKQDSYYRNGTYLFIYSLHFTVIKKVL